MAIYRSFKFKSSLIPGLIAVLLIATLGNALAQQAGNTANEQDIFVGDNTSTYGPIKASDTLWKIANAHRPDDSVTNYQVMVALFKTNPNAFVNNDINFLIQGQYLRIPTLEQINQVVPFHQQNDSDASLNRINNAIASKIKTPSEATMVQASSSATDVASVQQQTAKVDTLDETGLVESETAETEQIAQAQADNVTAAVALVSEQPDVNSTDTGDVTSVDQPASGLQLEGALVTDVVEPKVSNREVEESLAAVGAKLDSLQYELERSKQSQVELDQKLEEQNTLLVQAKKREQKLMAEQAAMKQRSDGLANSPVAYWSVIGLLFVLFAVLMVMVQRRRRVEKELLALKPALSANMQSKDIKQSQTAAVAKNKAQAKSKRAVSAQPVNSGAKNSKNSTAKANANTQSSNAQQLKNASVMQPSEVLFDGDFNQAKSAEKAVDVAPAAPVKSRDLIAEAFSRVELNKSYTAPDEADSDADSFANPDKNQAFDTLDNDLNMDHIIEDMVDEETKAKPAKLHSDSQANEGLSLSPSQLKEIDDFDDVEFDKLLEEISSESEHVSFETSAENTPFSHGEDSQAPVGHSVTAAAQDFVEIEDIIANSESSVDEVEPYQEGKIDVGLDEFPEFTQDVNPINVDDDKHGVNAKLDLAQVYIEIGDEDNAAVILKNVMKLGNSSQQQQAQQLLYSLKP
ncbi:FimV/HubP family polar landmark protein [Thalassotalea litorea]|uniref:FimV/HubP family polar landmark protein n=1 Tax=Thalassotalea litorea TaxID=2020715 RepID=UPI003734F361